MTAGGLDRLVADLQTRVITVSCRSCPNEFQVQALFLHGRNVLGTSVLCGSCQGEEEAQTWKEGRFSDVVLTTLHEAGAPVDRLGHMALGIWNESHDRPVAEARRFVASVAAGAGAGGGKGLYLHGPAGNGKTSLAVACMRELAQGGMGPGQMMFRVARALLREASGSYGGEHTERLIRRAKSVRLLVLDELGKEPPTDNSIALLSEILDYREGGTIVTSNFSLQELAMRYVERDGMESLISRLSDFRSLAFTGPDRRGRR